MEKAERTNLLEFIETYEEGDVKLDIGCGRHKRPGYIGCDFIGEPDVLMDLRNPWPFEDNSVDTIYSHHALEHFDRDEIRPLFCEAWRVLKPDGCLIGIVPHGHSDLAIGDPQHRMRWLEFTPYAFCSQKYDKSGMGQGLPFRPWVVEAVMCIPHKDFDKYGEKEFFFARKHFTNVFDSLAFVMRKTNG
jgi:SAM-dependent methyltransferase